MKTIDSYNFKNKIVLLRVDFNVPLELINNKFKIVDYNRIIKTKPTIDKILNNYGKIILISHLGSPINYDFSNKYSFKNIYKEISKILNIELIFYNNNINDINNIIKIKNKVKKSKNKKVFLLENIRFYKEEKLCDEKFSYNLSKLGDIYVNDAFSVSHRNHASITVLPKFFTKKCFGYLIKKEVDYINNILNKKNNNPITFILGGSKISSKISIINNIIDKIDNLIIGGGISYTFIKSIGGNIGNSIIENNLLNKVKKIMINYKEKIFIPVDIMAANNFSNNAKRKVVSSMNIPNNWMGLDIGPISMKKFSKIINNSKTIFWNGPMGVFEFNNFSNGTIFIANEISNATKEKNIFSLVGGGDSVASLKKNNCKTNFSYISTGGGAMLKSFEGKKLPGIISVL